jgi:hypothetical protein
MDLKISRSGLFSMNVRQTKSIRLYALPEELVGEGATIMHGQSSMPAVLPTTILRSDGKPLEKVEELYEWFKANLKVEGGYLVASAAIPALSLDGNIWKQAVAELKSFLSGYATYEGPVFVGSVGCTRSNIFGVADWYRGRLHGSVTVAIAIVRQEKVEEEKPFIEVAVPVEEDVAEEVAEIEEAN